MKRILIVAALLIGSLSVSAQRGETQSRELEAAKSMETLLSIYGDVNLYYVDTVSPSKLVQDAARGMLTSLDPYSEFISEQDMGDFEFSTTGKYGGVGALIRQRGEWVEIAEPYENSPSQLAGLKAGDRLLEIDGVDLKGLGSAAVSNRLKGDPGTTFKLKYRPIKDTLTTLEIEITRKRISVPAVPYYAIIDDSVGFIHLSSFTKDCAEEVRSAYEDMKSSGKLRSLILDLRSNGGGIVGEAINIIGMFVPKGSKVLEVRGKVEEMNSTYTTSKSPVDLDMPLAVLLNSSSASASEIVAGALQDLDRAVIIGNRSFGKGLVQSTRGVPYGGVLKLTTAKYYTPSGRCIQALDYTHRREDGSVEHIPDSLIQEFSTRAGRKVYDGGGIMPDVEAEATMLSQFTGLLMVYGYIDDFANIWAAHNTPAKEGFEVDDETYAQFTEFMQDKTFVYESLSALKLEEFREAAKNDKYEDRIIAELDAIAEKIKDDKNAELQRHEKEVKDLLTDAILTRLYFNKAAIEHSLIDDKVVDKAVEILDNQTEYKRILKEQDTKKN